MQVTINTPKYYLSNLKPSFLEKKTVLAFLELVFTVSHALDRGVLMLMLPSVVRKV